MQAQRILITGAAGQIGVALRQGLAGKYALLRLSDIAPLPAARTGEETCQYDLRDVAALEKSMQGIDCVVHLGGVSVEDSWEKVLPANIEGCYNVFEAARSQGVKSVVFASSNHAIGFHRRERFIDHTVVPRPIRATAFPRCSARRSAACMPTSTASRWRACASAPSATRTAPTEVRQLNSWISHRDMVQLVERCVDYPDYHFITVYGVSNNLRSRWDNTNVKFLGYRPQDNSEDYAAEIIARGEKENEIAAQFHGGFYCPIEFSGDTGRMTDISRPRPPSPSGVH